MFHQQTAEDRARGEEGEEEEDERGACGARYYTSIFAELTPQWESWCNGGATAEQHGHTTNHTVAGREFPTSSFRAHSKSSAMHMCHSDAS